MAVIYYDKDADPKAIRPETIAVLGYGNQGRAQALNLRDSGLSVVIGNIEHENGRTAREDAFDVLPLSEATRRGGIVFPLLPDEIMPDVYELDLALWRTAVQSRTSDFGSYVTRLARKGARKA